MLSSLYTLTKFRIVISRGCAFVLSLLLNPEDYLKITLLGRRCLDMFKSVYSKDFSMYYAIRSKTLSVSAIKHEECYLKRFDTFLLNHVQKREILSESLINDWVKTIKVKAALLKMK